MRQRRKMRKPRTLHFRENSCVDNLDYSTFCENTKHNGKYYEFSMGSFSWVYLKEQEEAHERGNEIVIPVDSNNFKENVFHTDEADDTEIKAQSGSDGCSQDSRELVNWDKRRCVNSSVNDFSDAINEQRSDNDVETEDDIQYQLFLANLKEHGNSYAIEYEKDGLSVLIPYEGDRDSDDDYVRESQNKLRSGIKQDHGLDDRKIHGKHDSYSASAKKMDSRTKRNSRNQDKSENVKSTVKCFTDKLVMETEYQRYIQTFKIVEDHIVATHENHTIVYGRDGNNDYMEEEHDEGNLSDMEILDSATFYKLTQDSFENTGNPTMLSEFRQNVIAVLRKPYNKEEYDGLRKEVEFCRKRSCLKLLRGGRDRKAIMNFEKSYLDDFPDLRMKLLQFEDDEQKCLNLLRGFFFWLQNLEQNGSFRPWQDKDCCSIRPEPQAGEIF